MKKNGRWIVAAVCFAAGFFVLYTILSGILRVKRVGDVDLVHSFYELEEDTLDVLVLGSSHAYYGYQPNLMWDEYGITSYSMTSPQQSVPMSYYLLKEMLQYQSPKVVLLESYYFWYDELYFNETRLHQGIDGMRVGAVKHELIQDFLGDRGIKENLEYYIPFLMYHGRWDKLTASDFDVKPYMKGGILVADVYEQEDPGLDIPAKEIPETALEYFERIVQLCNAHDTELVVFQTPYGVMTEQIYRDRQGVNLTLEEYLEERGIPFLFYQKTGEAQIDFANDFNDSSHLNIYGQTKITRCLGDYLVGNFEFQNHRGDAAYDSWERDYEKYEGERKALLDLSEEQEKE